MYTKHSATIFTLIVLIVVLLVLGHNLYRYAVKKEYVVTAVSACDPSKEACFKADPNDPDYPISIYKKVQIDAADAPKCLDEHTCTNFSCDQWMRGCKVTYCSPSTKDTGEQCYDQSP